MISYLRDDIYFCPDCRQFHDSVTEEVVEVPGMDYYHSPSGKVYKIRKLKKKVKVKTDKPPKGFGK